MLALLIVLQRKPFSWVCTKEEMQRTWPEQGVLAMTGLNSLRHCKNNPKRRCTVMITFNTLEHMKTC